MLFIKKKGYSSLLKATIIFLFGSAFITGTTFGQPTPFSCGSEGILTQSDPNPDPSEMLFVNMTSGDVTPVATLPTHVNGIGYNVLDDFVYGIDRDASPSRIIRIGANGEIEHVAGPDELNGTNPVVGDVDENGQMWVLAGGAGEWYQIDLASGMQVDSGPITGGGILNHDNVNDWTYIPGTNSLWTVVRQTADPSSARLYRFDRDTEQFTQEAVLGDLGDNNVFGATYTDSDGILYAGNNNTGVIWRIDVDNGTASQFAEGPITSQNDGARCFNAPMQVEITLEVGPCWRMLSSPVDGLTYADMLDSLWTQGVPGADYEGGEPNVLLWPDGQTGNDPADWQPPASLNDPIPAGTGFLVSVYADDDFDGIDDPFPKTITVSGPAHPRDTSPAISATPDGWTFVGNPYSQTVDFGELATNDLTDVGYIWDQNSGNWVSTTMDEFGDIPDGLITAGQGFFVQNDPNPTDPEIIFNDASRTVGGTFYGKQTGQNKLRDYVRLELQGESLYNSMWVRFSENGSIEPAYGDALELQPLSEQYALFAARKLDGDLVDIGHFPLPDEALEVPVHVEVTRPGMYTITATDLDLPVGMELYLQDRQTGESVLIRKSFEYRFSVDETAKSTPDQGIVPCSAGPRKARATGPDRFLITTTPGGPGGELPQQVALNQNYPNPFNPSTVISYQLPTVSQVHLDVYDMAGRKIATLVDGQIAAGTHQVNFDASSLSSGVYLYRLAVDEKVFTKKLTLIK